MIKIEGKYDMLNRPYYEREVEKARQNHCDNTVESKTDEDEEDKDD